MEWLNFINTETVEKAGAIVVALVSLGLCGFIFKSSRLQSSEFNHLLSNHLDHENKSRDALTSALIKLSDKIDNLK